MGSGNESRRRRLLGLMGLQRVAHRPPLSWRFWIYAGAAYLLPVVVHLGLPASGSTMDELVWLLLLVPAFILSLHYGLRGAFVALLVGTALMVAVQVVLVLASAPGDPRLVAPIFVAFGALAISVGWLSEQLHEHYRYAGELQAAQKAEALGMMTAGIAHDFNNILTAMAANAEILARDRDPADGGNGDELAHVREAARKGAGMVRNLLGFSRRGMLNRRSLALDRFVADRMRTIRGLVPEPIEIRLEAEDGLPPVFADAEAVERILMNLVTNARDAMAYAGLLEISVGRGHLDHEHRERTGWGDPGDYLCLSVRDTGSGMEPEVVDRVFEPFFTGKEPGEGVGLGMAMVYGLMKQHRGFVDVGSRRGVGTTVRAYFPVAKAPERDPPAGPAEALPEGGSETVLLVEDDAAIRRAAERILGRFGYRVITAVDGEEAVRTYRERSGEIDLVLTDVILPMRTGPELYEAIRTGPGRPPVLFMSGYPARTVRETTGLDPSQPFLQKPWSVRDLAAAVRAVLDESAEVEAAPGV